MRRRLRAGHPGFTLLELLVVVAVIALTAGLTTLALRDAGQRHLEQEGARLAAMLEAARQDARATGRRLVWTPEAGLASVDAPPTTASTRRASVQWLDAGTRAEVIGAPALVLGPDPILPPQRLRLSRESRSIVVSSDGIGPFRIGDPAP